MTKSAQTIGAEFLLANQQGDTPLSVSVDWVSREFVIRGTTIHGEDTEVRIGIYGDDGERLVSFLLENFTG